MKTPDSNHLRALQERVCREKGVSVETLHRLLAKVEEYSECHRAMGLPDELLEELQADLRNRTPKE